MNRLNMMWLGFLIMMVGLIAPDRARQALLDAVYKNSTVRKMFKENPSEE